MSEQTQNRIDAREAVRKHFKNTMEYLDYVMKLVFLQEVTADWSGFGDEINHIYITTPKGTFIGHIPHGTQEVDFWGLPKLIDKTQRKFKKVKRPEWLEENFRRIDIYVQFVE